MDTSTARTVRRPLGASADRSHRYGSRGAPCRTSGTWCSSRPIGPELLVAINTGPRRMNHRPPGGISPSPPQPPLSVVADDRLRLPPWRRERPANRSPADHQLDRRPDHHVEIHSLGGIIRLTLLVGEDGNVPASRERRPGGSRGCPRSPKPTVEARSPTSAVTSATQTGRLTTFDDRFLGHRRQARPARHRHPNPDIGPHGHDGFAGCCPDRCGNSLAGPVESTTPIEDRPSNVEDRTARSWPNGLLA